MFIAFKHSWQKHNARWTIVYANKLLGARKKDVPTFLILEALELLPWNRRDIWSLSDSNRTWIHNHLVCKQTLNYLAKLAKYWAVSTYMYGAFDCMFLSCDVHVSEWIHNYRVWIHSETHMSLDKNIRLENCSSKFNFFW